MSALKLYQVATPTSATQVSSTKQPVTQVVISKTMTTAATGVLIPSGQTLQIGGNTPVASFDITELYVLAGTGNVNILAILL